MRNVLLLQTANDFDDYGAAALVITAEHGRFIGANDVAFDDWLDAFAWHDRVHVRAHHDGLGVVNRAREARNYVAGVAGDFFAGVINFNLRSHFFTVALNALGDLAFFSRVTVDLHKFEQKILDAFLVDHSSSEGVSGSSNPTTSSRDTASSLCV